VVEGCKEEQEVSQGLLGKVLTSFEGATFQDFMRSQVLRRSYSGVMIGHTRTASLEDNMTHSVCNLL